MLDLIEKAKPCRDSAAYVERLRGLVKMDIRIIQMQEQCEAMSKALVKANEQIEALNEAINLLLSDLNEIKIKGE